MFIDINDVQPNDIIQILPDHKWEYSLAVVSEVKSWGVVAYIHIPEKGDAYIRLNTNEFVKVGTAIYVVADEDEVN